ncbi:hypothetical protein [Streptacidiphilus carbonis]|jgi:hypothetical protein|uniref:hypothetical protein n=1 Tax=Streptacidiphilus carbonis TaxID=105422 RepID=UPI0005A74264|nr:hypothetical protein [Streptacidiphilus carbonis]
MTTIDVPVPAAGTVPAVRPHRRPSAPAVVGVAYSLSWVAALSVGPGNVSATADGHQVVAAYAGQTAGATAQYLLSEGLPAVGLAVVGLALAGAARRAGLLRAARTTALAAVAAAAISAVQCLLGVFLVLSAVPSGATGEAHLLFELVNRMDGVKMLVLAVLALAGASLSRSGVAARWLRHPGYALAVTIAGSGIGYLLLLGGFTSLAYLSLPLLMLWVTGTGISLSRKAR